MGVKVYKIEGPEGQYYIISEVRPSHLPPGDAVTAESTFSAALSTLPQVTLRLIQLLRKANDNSGL